MKLKCRMAGKGSEEFACRYCDGVITKEDSKVTLPNIRKMLTLPRRPLADYTCPALTPSPESSDLVEVAE